jgi:hypothetical protein
MNWDKFLEALSNLEREALSAALNSKSAEFFEALAGNDRLTEQERHLRRSNGKIPAIKAVRERTQLGLKEAKDLVEGECPDRVWSAPCCPRCGQWDRVTQANPNISSVYAEQSWDCEPCGRRFKATGI